jgi:alpha-L-fucosidase
MQKKHSDSTKTTAPLENDQRTKWFREAKYGMFLHWGLYSVRGANEWAFFQGMYTTNEYAKLAKGFTAANYDPSQWAQVAKEAGMKYMVLTTRHHDGFALFNSEVSDFTAPKLSTSGRDLVTEYANAVRSAGLKVGFYFSPMDWRYKGAWDHLTYPESTSAMVDQCFAQVRELLTKYGKIDLMWFDGTRCMDPYFEMEATQKHIADIWRADEMHQMLFELQPHIVVNNRYILPGDFGTPEQRIAPTADGSMWESCLTMDPGGWGYIPYSPNTKTPARIADDMVDIARGGGNLLLNTGPKPDGTLKETDVERILENGKWRNRYAEVFEDADRSPLADDHERWSFNSNGRWIGSKKNPKVQYLFTRHWSGSEFWQTKIGTDVVSVTRLDNGSPVDYRQESHGRLVLFGLPDKLPDPLGTFFSVEFNQVPKLLPRPNMAEFIQSRL